jgi:hypothetical protein
MRRMERVHMRTKAKGYADGGIISGLVAKVTKPFRPPEGYTPATAAPAPAAPAPAPRPQLGGVNTGAISRREAAAGLKDGGMVPGKRNGNKDTVPIMATPEEAVLPVDTVDALGGPPAIKALIDATHTPVNRGPSAAARAYADGGIVSPEEPEPSRIGAGTNPFRSMYPGVRAVLRGSREDAGAAMRGGRYAQATGHVIRGMAALPVAAVADASQPARAALSTVAETGRDALTTAFTGTAPVATTPVTPAAAPRARGPVSAMGTPNAMDVRLDRGETPGVPSAGIPDASTNVVSSTPQLNTATDQALSAARAAAVARGESLGPGGAVIPGVNAPASQAEAELADRNARFDQEVLRGRAVSAINLNPGRRGAQAATSLLNAADGMGKTRQQAASDATREAGATERTRVTDQGATTRNRETIASTDRREGPVRAMQATKTALEVQSAIATQAAQERYRAAVASGDAKTIQAAEDELRAVQGKWEKPATPPKFSAVAIPGGVDPATGMPMGSGVAVVDQGTGAVRVMSPQEAKGGTPAPKFESGKVYVDGQGRRATWDGSKFVPAK